jgi:carbon monoxide dehydrogenase subunit G
MEMSGAQSVPAPQDKVWAALNDPELLKACIPGCESIESTGDNAYKIVMAAKVGPVSARFNGKMQLADLNPPNSYTLSFEGQGGAAGFAKGKAEVKLSPEGSGTQLAYTVGAQIGGKLAQIGSRLIDGAAKKTADAFFAAFVEKLGSTDVTAETVTTITPETVATAAPQVAATSPSNTVQGSSKTWLWIVGAVVVVGIIYFAMK